MKNNLLSIDEYRNNPEFYFSKGLRHANRKNLNEAYKNLSKALDLEPDNSEYKFNMACFLSELQCPKEANRMFNDILLNFEPTMYDCFFGLGCNSFELGDYKKAAEYFDKYLHFDGDGTFGEEVSEMVFYLKLYNEITLNTDFLKTSFSNLKKARKSLKENNSEKAMKQLYKSIDANPLNVEARNLLTLVLMEKRQYTRAMYINSTVENIDVEDVWAECMSVFIISNVKKNSRVKNSLDVLPFRPIDCREDLLCIAATLMAFDRTEELVRLMETYIVEYNDVLIYCILLLGYVALQKKENAGKITDIMETLSGNSQGLLQWTAAMKDCMKCKPEDFSAQEQYLKLFELNNEPVDFKYHPAKYFNLLGNSGTGNLKPGRKYQAIIDGAMRHREIMYSRNYKKEIIDLLISLEPDTGKAIEAVDSSYDAYSAALEFIYCRRYHIDMEKKELIRKYNINSILFEKVLKDMDRIVPET